MKRTLLALALFLSPTPIFAWGEKGHYLVNEAATVNVPYEMPRFFHEAYPGLVYLGYDPDRWKGAGESIDAVNEPEHFLDYEYVQELELPNNRYRYLEAMIEARIPERWLISIEDPGFVPWKIAELCEQLTNQWRLWRRATPGSDERKQIEQEIVYLSGILGHFVGDSANPHHATRHYNGWTSAENPNRFRNDCGTHSRFETQFVSRGVDIGDVKPFLAAPKLRTDYFATAMELLLESNGLLTTLYTLDRDGAFDYPTVTPIGKEFAARRLAAGGSYLRDLWWSTYVNSAQPQRRER